MPRLLLRLTRFFRQPSRHARLLASMDEVLLLIDQTAEETRQVCDRFLANKADPGTD
jgi:hypothetical protein